MGLLGLMHCERWLGEGRIVLLPALCQPAKAREKSNLEMQLVAFLH